MEGALSIYINDIIQYNLTAIKEKFLNITSMKLFVDEIRVKGINASLNFFILEVLEIKKIPYSRLNLDFPKFFVNLTFGNS